MVTSLYFFGRLNDAVSDDSSPLLKFFYKFFKDGYFSLKIQFY